MRALCGRTANMSIHIKLLAVLLACFFSASASAWSEETHMTTGAIAFDDLAANDPDVIAELDQILPAHPHYHELAARAAGLTGRNRTRKIFEWLARWPDDINGTEYEHRDWHYELRVVSGRTWLWPFRNGDASYAFNLNFDTLADRNAPARDRAIAIGWLIHIIGDIQQPLHAGHQMTGDFWLTDEAGSLAFVRKAEGGEPTNLHNYWDQLLDIPNADGKVEGDSTSQYWSNRLVTLWPRERFGWPVYSGTPQEQFGQWLDESLHLARLVGYTGNYLMASSEAENAPLVSAQEIRVARELAKSRVTTGGYRIADVLRLAVGSDETKLSTSTTS